MQVKRGKEEVERKETAEMILFLSTKPTNKDEAVAVVVAAAEDAYYYR